MHHTPEDLNLQGIQVIVYILHDSCLDTVVTQPKHCKLYYYFSLPNKITILVDMCFLNTYYLTKHQHLIQNGCSYKNNQQDAIV